MLKRRLLLLAVVVPSLFAAEAHADASAEEPRFNPPKQYYLALGDSFTYGFQFSKRGLPPSAFDTAYVDVFATRMRTIRPDLLVVNYGCPGESSVTFIAGGCVARAAGLVLHQDYEGAQLDAAVAFLRTHPGQVSPITLTLWSNDFLDLVRSCGGDFVCVQAQAPAAMARYASRLALILHRLRGVAPSAEIIVSGSWHPFLEHTPLFDAQFAILNVAIANAAMAEDARFADLVPLLNPSGEAARVTAICMLTLLCSEGDSHPSDAGYRTIAGVLYETSGYGRLVDESHETQMRSEGDRNCRRRRNRSDRTTSAGNTCYEPPPVICRPGPLEWTSSAFHPPATAAPASPASRALRARDRR